MFKVKNKYSLTSFWCFCCWFWPKSTYRYTVSTFNFEQVFVISVWKTSHNFLKTQKKIHLFCNKICKSYSFNDLSLHWIEIIITILWTYYEHMYVSSLNFLWESQAYHHRFVCYLICYIIALFQRFNLYHCIKPKAYFNHWSSGTNW